MDGLSTARIETVSLCPLDGTEVELLPFDTVSVNILRYIFFLLVMADMTHWCGSYEDTMP